jgi:hypothetical protein
VTGAVKADTKNQRNFGTGRDVEKGQAQAVIVRNKEFPEGMLFSLDRAF